MPPSYQVPRASVAEHPWWTVIKRSLLLVGCGGMPAVWSILNGIPSSHDWQAVALGITHCADLIIPLVAMSLVLVLVIILIGLDITRVRHRCPVLSEGWFLICFGMMVVVVLAMLLYPFMRAFGG